MLSNLEVCVSVKNKPYLCFNKSDFERRSKNIRRAGQRTARGRLTAELYDKAGDAAGKPHLVCRRKTATGI